MNIELSDEAIEILENLGGRMRLPDGLPQEERLALVIEAMADSADAQMELAVSQTGNPVAMQEAIDSVLNPDISTKFDMPTGDVAAPEPKQLTLKEITNLGGMHGKEVSEPLMQEAVVLVYNSIDKSEWNTKTADKLVEQTYELLQKKLFQNS